jgi:hypothetical protein
MDIFMLFYVIIDSIIVSGLVFQLLYYLKTNSKIKLPFYVIIILMISSFFLFLLTYFLSSVTIFGNPMYDLHLYFIISVFISAGVVSLLFYFIKKGTIKFNYYLVVLLGIILCAVLVLFFAFLLPDPMY